MCTVQKQYPLLSKVSASGKFGVDGEKTFFVSIFRHFSEFPSCFLRSSISAGGFKRSRAKDCRYKYGFQLFSLPFLASFALGWILVMCIFANKSYFVSLSSNFLSYRPRTSAASAKKNYFPLQRQTVVFARQRLFVAGRNSL